MILTSRQYKDLKPTMPLKNKVRSVNTVIQKVEVSQESLVNSITKTFTRPTTIDLYTNSPYSWDTVGVGTGERGEASFFEVDEVFTYTNPTEVSRIELIRSATRKNAEEPFEYLESAQPPETFTPTQLTTQAARTAFDPFIQKWFINQGNYATTGPSNRFPGVGWVDVFNSPYATSVYVPPGPSKPISIAQPSLFRAELKGIQPYYTSGAWKRRSTTYQGYPYPSYATGFFEWLLEEITINVYARTSTITEVPFKSSTEKPELELPENELMQYDAVTGTVPVYSYIAEQISNAMYSGRQLVDFKLVDESVEIEMNDEVQIADKLGVLLKNGKYFRILSIAYEIGGSTVRTIKAMEVD